MPRGLGAEPRGVAGVAALKPSLTASVTYADPDGQRAVKIVEADRYKLEGRTATFFSRHVTPVATYNDVMEIEAEGVSQSER